VVQIDPNLVLFPHHADGHSRGWIEPDQVQGGLLSVFDLRQEFP